jgi:PAN domain
MSIRSMLIMFGIVLVLPLAAAAQTFPTFSTEPGFDRPGGDFDTWVVDGSNKEAWRCHDSCFANPRCKAYTFVKPATPDANGLCRLKETVPAAVAADCCVSGVKGQTGVSAATKPPPPPQTSFEANVTALCVPRSPTTMDGMIRLSGRVRVEVAADGTLKGTFEGEGKGTLTGRRGADGKASGEVVMADGGRVAWKGEITRDRDGVLNSNGTFDHVPDSMFGPQCAQASWATRPR